MQNQQTNTLATHSVEQTQSLARALAGNLHAGDVVVLNGDLGAGKTHFVQGLAQALGIEQAVTSPTFNILLSYPVDAADPAGISLLNHFDLYRLEDESELDDIGYWEVLEGEGATCIEWGDKFPDAMPDDYLELTITSSADGVRTIAAQAHGVRSEELLCAWIADVAAV